MAMNWLASNAYAGVPPNAVIAGNDIDGTTIYVGRAYHDGDLIPAKVIPSKQIAYVPHGGQEISKQEFHILTGFGFEWVASAGGHVPAEAVIAGNQADGAPLYVGRASVGGSLSVGKIHPGHHCIYVPFDGIEHKITQYEVLTAPRRSTWIQTSRFAPLPEGAILAGHDQDGSQIYVGRAWHDGDHIPAKVIPSKQAAYVAHGGNEVLKDEFEVLCYGNVSWIKIHASTRTVPPFSVTGGVTSEGEPLYIGRAYYEGSLTVGKVHMSHGALYIPFAGREVPIHSEIEVLVEN